MEHPRDAACEVRPAHDRGCRGAEGVRVEGLPRSNPRERDAPRSERAVDVDDSALVELPRRLAVGRGTAQSTAEALVERARCARHPGVREQRRGEYVCLDRFRRARFDLEPHREAMLSDGPPTLAACGAGLNFGAVAPIQEAWRLRPCGGCVLLCPTSSR